ncbi:MAG TPA: hypothetical protein VKR52_03140 [Terracidiphilus sp.]|nr:hypothetical protein [Terracidiphilus sp.]
MKRLAEWYKSQHCEHLVMDTAVILEKLIEIEKALGVRELATIRKMIIDVQESILEMQKRSVDTLRAKGAYM